MPEESRRFTRVQFEVPAILTVGSSVFSIPYIINLSVGGALIPCSEQELKPEIDCLLQIPLGGTTTIQVLGEIAWSSPEIAAIKFTTIDPDNLSLLQNVIRYNSEDPDKVEDEIKERPGLI